MAGSKPMNSITPGISAWPTSRVPGDARPAFEPVRPTNSTARNYRFRDGFDPARSVPVALDPHGKVDGGAVLDANRSRSQLPVGEGPHFSGLDTMGLEAAGSSGVALPPGSAPGAAFAGAPVRDAGLPRGNLFNGVDLSLPSVEGSGSDDAYASWSWGEGSEGAAPSLSLAGPRSTLPPAGPAHAFSAAGLPPARSQPLPSDLGAQAMNLVKFSRIAA